MTSVEVIAKRPPAARKTQRRNRDQVVLEEAIHVISERGYAGTSIQEVADRVGVLKGSLYHYFSSKEELLFRILEQSHKETTDIAEEVAQLGLPPLEELLEYLKRSSLWYIANVQRANIFFTEMRNLTGDRLAEAKTWGRYFESHIQRLVTSAQESGEIRSDQDPRLITRFVIGAVNNVRDWPSRSGKKFSATDIAEALVALVRNAVAP
ncbi:TetR/AcrR family transcriptional regulator [Arthrobacter sp. CC3]|uniref:TetR/AcrR family transcriptional regulator n=1 Tax=Arthrobacter sp. CC3 TaxID=3029185 RepID=UPI0032667851